MLLAISYFLIMKDSNITTQINPRIAELQGRPTTSNDANICCTAFWEQKRKYELEKTDQDNHFNF